MKLLAKTLFGLEEVLEQELRELGATEVVRLKRAVAFEGEREVMYKANLYARTALRILLPIHEFYARDEGGLYRGVQAVNWQQYLGVKDTFAIDSVVSSRFFKHSHYAALKAKDAIVDQFRNRGGKRPSIDLKQPTVRINLHIARETCTLSLDSSGDSLHKRGYRLAKNPAPLNEVLAAGMIALSGWKADRHFVDPMCGSGTLPIEAAMRAYGVPPGYHRSFGFMHWKDFDRELWQQLHRAAEDEVEPYFSHQILGSDQDRAFVGIAQENLRRAKLARGVQFDCQPMAAVKPPAGPGLVMINPPYGERIKPDDLFALYAHMGDILKQRFAGYQAWILSANKEALKHVGLRPYRKLSLYNGALPCFFYGYELYRGSKSEE